MEGSWATTSAFIKAKIAEMEMEIDDAEMAAPRTEQENKENQPRGRPRLRRENATTAENSFVNNKWLDVTDSMTDSFSARNSADGISEGQWMGSSMPRKPVRSRAEHQQQRPREQLQRGLVNDWWAERLRADNVTPPNATSVERMGLTTLKDLLTSPTKSKRELPVVSKNSEIWEIPPPEENGEAIQVLPARRARTPLLHEDQKKDTWRNGFLASLPLTGSLVERPASPKQGAFGTDSNSKASERPFDSFHLFEMEDIQPSLPYGVIDPDPLEPIKLEGSGIWSSQLSKDMDLIDTEYSWDFAPLERVLSRSSEPQKARTLTDNKSYSKAGLVEQPSELPVGLGIGTSARSNAQDRILPEARPPLNPIREYEESEEEIDELDQDIESSSAASWDDSSSGSSDSSDISEYSGLDENEDDYFDPIPSFTWYADLPDRPGSPTRDLERMEDIAQVPAVQQWMSQRLQAHVAEATDQSLAADMEDEDEILRAASLPLSVLMSDPRYANQDVLPTPRAAQDLLVERALEPERRSSLYPPRCKIVVQKAKAVPPYPTETLLGNFYRKIMEDHADVEMQDAN